MILLTVTGIFKERHSDPKLEFIRSFQRTLVIVPNNNGFCIRNELFHVNNASPKQERAAFKGPILIEPQQQIAGSIPPPASFNQPDDSTKLQMIQTMSQQSNMNLDWSRKCLEETQWNFERAAHVFTELHKQNKIPPEAFVK
jgi:nuclear RNA export factor